MRIDDLDESQGLTTEMVREWLTAQNATFRNGHWTHPNGKYRYKDGKYGGLLWSLTLSQIAADFGKANEQALLREINPRMRKGMPSDAAAKAHGDGGWWVFQHLADADGSALCGRSGGELHMAQMVMSSASGDVRFYWERGLMGEPCDEACMWWPCDKHGNKVRWPTDAEGKML